MRRTVIFTGALLCLFIAVSAAHAEGPCSLRTMAGTYAFFDKGASMAVDPSQPAYQPYFVGVLAPFVTVGEITFGRNGVGNGYYWIYIGGINGGFDARPVQVTITEMNADCTGKYQYNVTLPGIPSATIEERFILFDDGREWRSVPTSIQNGIDTLAWLGTGRRISNSSAPVRSCGPHTAHGTYLLSAENIVEVSFDPAVAAADNLFIRQDISMNGDWTGRLYEKLGPVSVNTPALGTFAVNPDCSFNSTLRVPEFFPNAIVIKGVLFNEGKEYYALAIEDLSLPPDQQGIKFSFAYGKRIGQ